MKTLLLATAVLTAISAVSFVPAYAQAPNDISSKLAQGKAYTETGRAHRRSARAMRRHRTMTPSTPAAATTN